MAAVLSPHTDGVRAALVFQAVALSEPLKAALAGAGVQVVVEVRADGIDRAALDAADPQVFVVNLDPDLEDHLDELTEVLDGFSRPVIFNDASASSGLSGWDQARWARHLGAKIKGEVDAHPPRPEGSTFIPAPERKIVQIAAPRAVSNPPTAALAPAAPATATSGVAAEPTKPAPVVPVLPAAPIPVQVAPAAAAVAVPVAQPPAQDTSSSAIDVDALFADLLPSPAPAPRQPLAPTIELPVVPPRAAAPSAAAPPDAGTGFGLEVDDSAFDFELSADAGSSASSDDFDMPDFGSPDVADSNDLDSLWSEAGEVSQPATNGQASTFGSFDTFDSGFDAPLDGESLADFELPEPPARPGSAELTDLDDLFRELEPKNAAAPVSAAATPAATKPVEPVRKPAELKAPPTDWSLEPLDGEGLADTPVPSGRAQFKIGQDASVAIPPVVAAPPASAPAAAVTEQADTELAAFDFFFEPSGAAPPPADVNAVADKARAPLDLADIPDFGLSLEPLDIPEPPPPAAAAPRSPPAQTTKAPVVPPPPVAARPAPVIAKAPAPAEELGAFDFNFDNFDDPPASSKSAGQRGIEAAALADLDGLFADIEAPPVVSDVPNLDRVWILGASIGGPEAVRSFLVGLKKQVASAFILAQHMGSEFLDLMISQLAKASPLPVKVAQPGDKLQNGSVLVAPVGKRLTVDAQGRVQLGEMSSDMPYSPSIDQIMFDMADRFGPRCSAVIFSGMASDAIEGAKYIASKGGRIWVQDPSTCVISSMIDGAQAAGVVSYVGSPEQLAEHLQAHLT